MTVDFSVGANLTAAPHPPVLATRVIDLKAALLPTVTRFRFEEKYFRFRTNMV